MRTTLDVDDDVLQAAKERARRERKTAGKVLSELARKGLATTPSARRVREPAGFLGFKPFAGRGGVVTNEIIDNLRDEDAY